MLTAKDVSEHDSRQSCWVIIQGHAYDLTDFIDDHPGGLSVIMRYAGKDATEEYLPIHPADTLEKHLPKGTVDMSSLPEITKPTGTLSDPDSKNVMPLKLCQNLLDIELQASKTLTERAYTYFHSAAETLSSMEANGRDWNEVSFRPRVLRNVARVDMTRRIMGQRGKLPFFIAPMAMIRLADQEGELALAKAAGTKGIPYSVSTYASYSHEEIMRCVKADKLPHLQFFQLYVPKKQEKGIELIQMARQLGFKALLVTVDTPVVGRREEDDRYKARVDYQSGVDDSPRTLDTSEDNEIPVLRGVHSSPLNWEDLKWIREAWGGAGPIILKGIQCAEDAKLAFEMGVEGIYLSNHGGRQLDYAPSSIQTLLEIRRFCPEILGKIEIYLDGRIRRGTDILKAICLGATAVGVGRPFGAVRAIELLSDEIETTMRLLGVNSLAELNSRFVNTKELERSIVDSISGEATDELLRPRL